MKKNTVPMERISNDIPFLFLFWDLQNTVKLPA